MATNPINENWDDDDNKKVRGQIDRVSVALTEPYEVKYFVDAYLSRRKITDNASNRKVIEDTMKQYPGRAPIQRDKLNDWLDGQITVSPVK